MSRSEGLVNTIARNETVWTALQYLGYALRSNSYMGVGRNMMFKKQLFEEVSGFDSHLDVMSGDDDLFIQSVLGRGKIGVALDPKSMVMTTAKTNWIDFYKQKTRHVSTSFEYGWKHKVELSIFAASQIFWFLGLIILILSGTQLYLTIVISLAYWVLMMIGTVRGYGLMKAQDLWQKLPLMDVLMAIYYLILGGFTLVNRLRKNTQWN